MEFQKHSTEVSRLLQELSNSKDQRKILNLVGSLSAILIEQNYPYIPKMVQQVKKVNDNMEGNGVVHIQLKMFKGDVQEAVFHEITKLKF